MKEGMINDILDIIYENYGDDLKYDRKYTRDVNGEKHIRIMFYILNRNIGNADEIYISFLITGVIKGIKSVKTFIKMKIFELVIIIPDKRYDNLLCYRNFSGRANQDRFVYEILGDGIEYMAVFDGHGKTYTVSEILVNVFHLHFTKVLENIENVKNSSKDIQKCFLDFDMMLYDNDLIDKQSGSTAVIAVITKNMVIVVTLGDSSCIIFDDFGKIFYSNTFNNPHDINEKIRILKNGGYVKNGRVDGKLAVSRAFGDFMYKMDKNGYVVDGKVSAIPIISYISKNELPSTFNIALFSDGISDVYDNEKIAKKVIKYGDKSCDIITEGASERTTDDVTILIKKFKLRKNLK